jgi:hypothetical protein
MQPLSGTDPKSDPFRTWFSLPALQDTPKYSSLHPIMSPFVGSLRYAWATLAVLKVVVGF